MNATATERLNDRMNHDNGFSADPQSETALAVLNRTEIDQQIATAKRYPRSIARAKQKMIEMACNDLETAQGCVYALKRNGAEGGNYIEGPSVRLAEIAVNAWGNLRAGARIIGEDGGFIVAQGICHDLEANSSTSIEVRRRITNRQGKRYSDDMVGVTANAACAIAFRNAVFKIVPKVYINPAYDAAQKLIAGDERSIGQRRQSLVSYFGKMHVDLAQIMAFLDKPEGGLDDITGNDLVRLHGVATAIRDGDTTIDEAFPSVSKSGGAKASASTAMELNARLDQAKAAESSEPPAEPEVAGAAALADRITHTLPDTQLTEAEAEAVIQRKAAQANVSPSRPPAEPEAETGLLAGEGDHENDVEPEAPEDGSQWPSRLPDFARKGMGWMNDRIVLRKGGLTAHEARKRFAAMHAPHSWEKLAPEIQDALYESLRSGEDVFGE